MFARLVTIKLKSDTAAEFIRTLGNDVVPLLRKQDGFLDEVCLLAPDRTEATAISFWSSRQDTEKYSRTAYADILKTLSKFIEGTPHVKSFDVSLSTLHKIAAGQAS